MYMKKVIFILSMLVSANLFASSCNVDFVSQNADNYQYMVNGKAVLVNHTNAIANLLIAKEIKTNIKHRGIVKQNQVCLNLSENCVDVYSNDIKEYIQLFLVGNFCAGDQK